MPLITVQFRCDSRIDPDSLFDSVSDEMETNLSVRSLSPDSPEEDEENPEGTPRESHSLVFPADTGLRGVFVSADSTRVTLSTAPPAASGDYELMSHLAQRLREITGSEWEFPDKDHEDNPYLHTPGGYGLFSEEWVFQCLMTDYIRFIRTMMEGDPYSVYDCFHFPVAFGPRLFAAYRLYPPAPPSLTGAKAYTRLMADIARNHTELADAPRTMLGRCMMRRFSDPVEREAMEHNEFTEEDARRILEEIRGEGGNSPDSAMFTMSAIAVNESESIEPPRLIIYGDYVSFIDTSSQEQLATVPFSRLDALTEELEGSYIDEFQFVLDKPLDVSQIAGMLASAPRVTPPSPFLNLIYPGMGTPVEQDSHVLFWRPGKGSITIAEFRRNLPTMQTYLLRWEVAPDSKVKMGDRFYIVCVSPRMPRGIVMSGIFSSNPYSSEDGWVADLRPNFMMDPRNPALLTSDLLNDALPELDWTGKGLRTLVTTLSEEGSQTLEELWAPELAHAQASYTEAEGRDRSVNAFTPSRAIF